MSKVLYPNVDGLTRRNKMMAEDERDTLNAIRKNARDIARVSMKLEDMTPAERAETLGARSRQNCSQRNSRKQCDDGGYGSQDWKGCFRGNARKNEERIDALPREARAVHGSQNRRNFHQEDLRVTIQNERRGGRAKGQKPQGALATSSKSSEFGETRRPAPYYSSDSEDEDQEVFQNIVPLNPKSIINNEGSSSISEITAFVKNVQIASSIPREVVSNSLPPCQLRENWSNQNFDQEYLKPQNDEISPLKYEPLVDFSVPPPPLGQNSRPRFLLEGGSLNVITEGNQPQSKRNSICSTHSSQDLENFGFLFPPDQTGLEQGLLNGMVTLNQVEQALNAMDQFSTEANCSINNEWSMRKPLGPYENREERTAGSSAWLKTRPLSPYENRNESQRDSNIVPPNQQNSRTEPVANFYEQKPISGRGNFPADNLGFDKNSGYPKYYNNNASTNYFRDSARDHSEKTTRNDKINDFPQGQRNRGFKKGECHSNEDARPLEQKVLKDRNPKKTDNWNNEIRQWDTGYPWSHPNGSNMQYDSNSTIRSSGNVVEGNEKNENKDLVRNASLNKQRGGNVTRERAGEKPAKRQTMAERMKAIRDGDPRKYSRSQYIHNVPGTVEMTHQGKTYQGN